MDNYSANPMAELMAQRDPLRYEALLRVSTPPKAFANGTADVPAFTASGIDPQQLLKLPYGVRHAAAMNTDIVQVYRWFEEYAGYPEAEVECDGLRDYRLRVERWMQETDPRTPAEIEAERVADEQMYEAYVRSRDRDGLLPEERQQMREARFQALHEGEKKRHELDSPEFARQFRGDLQDQPTGAVQQ